LHTPALDSRSNRHAIGRHAQRVRRKQLILKSYSKKKKKKKKKECRLTENMKMSALIGKVKQGFLVSAII
jgi:hypothetical protein